MLGTNRSITQASGQHNWWLAGWLPVLVALPALVGLLALVGVGYREASAVWELQSLRSTVPSGSNSQGDTWIQHQFEQTTSKAATADWSKILFLVTATPRPEGTDLPIIGNAQLPPLLDRQQPWNEEPAVANYLQRMAPVLELIQQAVQQPGAMWQPIAFEGYSTLLPELDGERQVARLLRLEVEHALYHGQAERARRGLAALKGVCEAFDWRLFMVSDLVNMAVTGMLHDAVQRSLQTDVWTAEDLRDLLQQTAEPFPIAERWSSGLRAEQAWVEQALADGDMPAGLRLVNVPSAQRELLTYYDSLQSLPERVTGQPLSAAAKTFERAIPTRGGTRMMLLGHLSTAAQAYAAALERSEQSRKVTRVALALKLFHLQEQRWPEELPELTSVGLAADDWNIFGHGQVGYRVVEDRAYVWGVLTAQNTYIDEPPTFDMSDESRDLYSLTVVLP